VAVVLESFHEMRPEKASAAGDEDPHGGSVPGVPASDASTIAG
jgi:hypothetical protein